MRYTISLLMTALFLPSFANGEFIDQISSPFVSTTFNGSRGILSQYDTGLVLPDPNGDLPNFATAYDNFTLTTLGSITDVSWIGLYESDGGTHTNNFTVSVYAGSFSQPTSALQIYNLSGVSETSLGSGLYSYTASVAGTPLAAGQTYWVSVVAQLNYAQNGWGWAVSSIGNRASVQDFQNVNTKAIERNFDATDYAFSLRTVAVPEPTGGVLFGVVFGALAFKRRRRLAH